MKIIPRCSLIISTYNWPEALELCLLSILKQSILPDEVIIADDGSREETKNLIQSLQNNYPVPLLHVWHQDNGFQLSKIRNKALALARFEYIIQVDGDVLLNQNFVKDHLSFAKQNTFVSGRRVLLNPLESEIIFRNKDLTFTSRPYFKNNINGLRIPFLQVFFEKYKTYGAKKFYVIGCNMAYWREDALKTNGYNESFVGWGPEDSEFAARLINSKIKKRFLKFGGIMYHIYHQENCKSLELKNRKILQATIEKRITKTETGIIRH